MGSFQLVSDCLIQEVKQKQVRNYSEADPKYDFENVMKGMRKDLNNICRADFRSLRDDFSDMFSINQWDPGNCDANSHGTDMKPGSQPAKLPNGTMQCITELTWKKN